MVDPRRRRGARWKALIGVAGLAGLAVAAFTTVGDARDRALPGAWPMAAALGLHVMAVLFTGRAWVSLFPADADRPALASGLYTSQLTKYLPAGGFVQAASQVALSSQPGGMAAAALRLPVFSLCSVVAALTVGSAVALNGDLAAWARALAGACLLSVFALDRRLLARLMRRARRVVKRLPEPDTLPPQRSILRCYLYGIANLVAFSAAFVILLGDVTDIRPLTAGAALSAGWAAGFLVVFLPSGLVVREAVVLAALPTLASAPLLTASVAHRLVGFVAEAAVAGAAHLRNILTRRQANP